MENNQLYSAPVLTALEVPRTAGDAAKELGVSVTTVKELARQIKATVIKTAGGYWILPPSAVEKLRAEIQRRELEAMRR